MRPLANWQLLCWGVLLLVSSEFPAAAEQAPSYIAQAWTSDDGLPATEILAIVQSPECYLWIGTPNGLARFDGERFVTLRKAEAPGLTSNRILSLCQDGEGGIWIGTEDEGLTHYSKSQTLTPRVQGLSSMAVLSVHVDEHGVLWAGSAAGLNRWEVNRFVPYLKVDGLPDETVTVITRRPGGDLLIGTGAGVAQFTDGRLKLFAPESGLPSERVSALCVEQNGRVWVGAESGLYCAEGFGDKVRCSQVSNDGIVSILDRANGEIWFGTSSGSLRSIRPGQRIASQAYKFDSPPTVLLEDHERNIWAGTRQGLFRLRKRQLHFIGSTHGQEVTSYYACQGGPEAQTFKDGTLQVFQRDAAAGERWLAAPKLASTVDGYASSLWIGTLGQGLWQWDGHTARVWGQREGLSDISVTVVHAVDSNSVWVGTMNAGLNHVTGSGVRRYLTPWGFTGNYASAIVADDDGTVWIGTTGDGLFCLRKGVFTNHSARSGLPSDRISSLILDPDRALWAGTAGGLSFWNGTNWFSFSRKNGVPEEAIDQMQDDLYGNLWLGCGQSIYRLSKAQLRGVAKNITSTAYAISYGRSDGLIGASMLPGAQISRNSRRDKVVFSTTKGLLIIEPGRYESNTNPPPILIQEVLIGSEALPPGHTLKVPPGRQTIQFRYAALSFAAPEKIQFRCRLTAFDQDWIDVGGSRTMRYAGVPPGTYTFQVVACNNDGVWNTQGASIAVIVSPFWWETNWFRVGVSLSAGSALAALVLFRRQRNLEMERLRTRIAGDLHDEIGASLWSITLLSKMLQQGDNLSEDDKRDAGEIYRISSQTSNALRDIVWLINPGLDTLQDMVLRMRDFLSATVRGLEVHLRSDEADLSRKLSLEMRQSFFLVFKEAVTNVAKHAHARRLEVTLAERQETLEMRVCDDGVGFDTGQPARGHGLHSLRRRAEAVRGQVIIESATGQGTSVLLRAPLRSV